MNESLIKGNCCYRGSARRTNKSRLNFRCNVSCFLQEFKRREIHN